MKKFTLLTFDCYKEELLKSLQRFENMHFKDLQKREDTDSNAPFLEKVIFHENVSALEAEQVKIKFALDKIKPYAQLPSGLKALTTLKETITYAEFDNYADHYDYTAVYMAVKEADERLRALKTEKERVKSEIQSLQSWIKLDISMEAVDKLKSVTHFIGSVNKASADSFLHSVESAFSCAHVEFFGGVKDEVNALIIAPVEETAALTELLKNIGFTKQNLNFQGVPSEMIRADHNKIAEIDKKEAAVGESLAKYGGEYHKLSIALDYFNTALERARSCENFLRLDNVIMMEGWAPAADSSTLNTLVKKVCGDTYYLEEDSVDKDSVETPIKLKNNKLVSAFESITSMYSLPKYNELDPTPVLTPFYIMFFGLMVGDVGYGLLLLVLTTMALQRLQLKKSMRGFIQFFHYLSYSVIGAGALYGSMFGFAFFTPIQTETGSKAILDSQLDIQTMIILSVAVGVFQIMFGLGVKAYMLVRDGKILDAVFDSLLYAVAILAAIGLIVNVAVAGMPTFVGPLSKWGLIISLIGLAATQGRQSPSLGGKIGNGLYAVYGLTSYVGDFISYTRIVALALSGAYIAYSFNLMAGIIPGVIGKILFGGIIMLIGHALNIGLALLGAYVHTCRLQYVEFFGKFYEGGGKAFKPLAMKNDAVNLN